MRTLRFIPLIALSSVFFVLNACAVQSPTPILTYRTVKTYPHDPQAFTQGLVYENGVLFESVGMNGQSDLRKVELETGKVLQRTLVAPRHFAEGLALVGQRLIQLTWQTQTGFVYNRDSFQITKTFTYPNEGWGLTYNGTHLIMSDGTSTLYFLNPITFERVQSINVTDENGAIININELEFIDGQIYANIWQTDTIARIDPKTGKVTTWIDLTGLLPRTSVTTETDVLNGIAYDTKGKRLFVTGKYWPLLFEIQLIPKI